MNDMQSHRGPDGEGYWNSYARNVYLAHKRLAIIDLSSAGHQPMISNDNKYVIDYNGELYNYKSLKEICIKRGSKFSTHTDTEVIIEYIRQFGLEGIKDFRGMWAFALYNTQENKVVFSRDPFGIKPLHYGIKDNTIYFASEIKSLRCIDPYFNEIDETTKQLFLDCGYLDLGDWTFFQNIKRFPAASYAEIDLNKKALKIDPVRYWQPPSQIKHIADKEAVEKLDKLLRKSIERHMVSDVPLAFCLSGGLDSSVIVGIASAEVKNSKRLNAFTTHYPDFPEFDETYWAKMVVKHCKVTPHFTEVSYDQFLKEFDSVLYHHDEPFGSTSIYAQNSIFKAINDEGLKVSLDGQGADEIFAGYTSYHYFFLKFLLQERKFLQFLYESIALVVKLPNFVISNLHYIKRILSRGSNGKVTNNEYKERLGLILQTKKSSNFHEHLLNTLLYSSIPQLLRNGDRNSMKNHVESRVPFLDVDLVDFVVSLPDNFKIRRAIKKYILRQVAYKYLPKKVADRKDKMGFPAPEKSWMAEAFNIQIPGSFTKQWREFITARWEKMINESK